MDDEKKFPGPAPEGDPGEVKVVRDIFDLPAEEQPAGGDDVFNQDIFGDVPAPPTPKAAPPIPPPPPPPPPRADPQPSPPSAAEPEPPAGAEENNSDVKVVGFDDFDKLSTPNGLSVEGKTFSAGENNHVGAEEDDDDDMPEFVMTSQPPSSPATGPAVETAPEEAAEEEPKVAEAVDEDEDSDAVFVSQTPLGTEAGMETETGFEDETEVAEAVDEDEGSDAVFVSQTPLGADAGLEAEKGFEDEAEVAETPGDEDVNLLTDAEPVAFKAAKAKEGPEAVKQTQELIEHLDGMDGGFLDAAEIESTVQTVRELKNEIAELKARIETLEAKLK